VDDDDLRVPDFGQAGRDGVLPALAAEDDLPGWGR
jgi:hypothetical protein